MPVNGPSYYGGTLMAPSISLSSRLRHRPTGPGDVLFQMEEYTLNKVPTYIEKIAASFPFLTTCLV